MNVPPNGIVFARHRTLFAKELYFDCSAADSQSCGPLSTAKVQQSRRLNTLERLHQPQAYRDQTLSGIIWQPFRGFSSFAYETEVTPARPHTGTRQSCLGRHVQVSTCQSVWWGGNPIEQFQRNNLFGRLSQEVETQYSSTSNLQAQVCR